VKILIPHRLVDFTFNLLLNPSHFQRNVISQTTSFRNFGEDGVYRRREIGDGIYLTFLLHLSLGFRLSPLVEATDRNLVSDWRREWTSRSASLLSFCLHSRGPATLSFCAFGPCLAGKMGKLLYGYTPPYACSYALLLPDPLFWLGPFTRLVSLA
jgi:hypothetical protein